MNTKKAQTHLKWMSDSSVVVLRISTHVCKILECHRHRRPSLPLSSDSLFWMRQTLFKSVRQQGWVWLTATCALTVIITVISRAAVLKPPAIRTCSAYLCTQTATAPTPNSVQRLQFNFPQQTAPQTRVVCVVVRRLNALIKQRLERRSCSLAIVRGERGGCGGGTRTKPIRILHTFHAQISRDMRSQIRDTIHAIYATKPKGLRAFCSSQECRENVEHNKNNNNSTVVR